MTLHCPHCLKQFEKGHFPLGDEVSCIYCGKVFRVSKKETIPVPPGAPAGPAAEMPPEGAGPDDASRVRNTQLTPVPGRAEVGGQLGGYTLERELGRGGMGVVFLANQESLGRKVAVKVLPRKLSQDDAFVRRFDREAQSLAKLNHPNIVGILDKGRDGDVYYFVMEFVHGVSLREILEEKRLTPGEALRIVRQICSALEYAHDEGVVHRDIKPENILIDRKGNAKIADFGLARLVSGDSPHSRITRSQMVMGSPDYMAPEQRESPRDVDHRADLYSLGVVLYEMLTGELPLGNFPPPSQKNLGLDINIDRIVLKVLNKNPELRYRNASDVATEIEGLSATNGRPRPHGGARGRQVTLWARGTAREAIDFAKRHPFAAAALAIPLGVMVLGAIAIIGPILAPAAWVAIPLAVIAWLWHDTHQANRRAEMKARAKIEAQAAEADQRRRAQPAAAAAAPPPPEKPKPPGHSIAGPLVLLLAALILIVLIAINGPVSGLLMDAYFMLGAEEMIAALVASLTLAIPCLVILLLSFFARSRAKRLGQKGRFFATIAILLSLYNLVWFSRTWAEYSQAYRHWSDMESRASLGDQGALRIYEANLQSDDFDVRRRTAWSLLRTKGDAVTPLLGTLLDDTDEAVRWRAARNLDRRGDAAVPYLIRGLTDTSYRVRLTCAQALEPRLPFEIDPADFRSGENTAGTVLRITEWWEASRPRKTEIPDDF